MCHTTVDIDIEYICAGCGERKSDNNPVSLCDDCTSSIINNDVCWEDDQNKE